MTTKSSIAIDVYVGSRIRMRRTMLGLSQGTLGDGLGITFQQVQKYEKGINRVGAGRLQRISELLSIPVSFFFEGDMETPSDRGLMATRIDPSALYSKESMALVKAFLAIDEASIRQRVLELIQSLGGRTGGRERSDAEPRRGQSDDE